MPNLMIRNEKQIRDFTETLQKEGSAYGINLSPVQLEGLSRYYQVLNIWNSRLHLVAPTSPQEFATRHVLESLLLLSHLPGDSRIADVGSGGGLPIIPTLIVRPDINAVLIEASKKKAVFLREALNETGIPKRAHVVAERFEMIAAPNAGFVTCRALERFEASLPELIKWAPAGATLLFFGGAGLGKKLKESGLNATVDLIPNSKKRFLFVTRKA